MTANTPPRWFNTILLGVCASLLTLLATMVKWHGDRIYKEMDELNKAVRALERYQEGSEGSQEYLKLRATEHTEDINELDDRVRALERGR